jgi:threonine dehydratase
MNINMIRAAAERAKGHLRVTPLLSSPSLDAMAGRRILVKAEALQITGSFKARGGWAAVSALDPEIRRSGVIAFSSGNHAQGVAYAARAFDVPAVIIMPQDAPLAKINGTKALGAEVILYDRMTEDRDALGAALSLSRNLTLIRPFDDPEVIAGQGTCGVEIAAQAGDLVADVLVCCGGGGLTAGIALALEADAPGLRVRPVEPVDFDDVSRSLASGRIERNAQPTGSICDAILTPQPGNLTFPIMQKLCGAGISVTDQDVLRAMAVAFRELKIVLEPGGAVALAAALYQGGSDPVIVVASGGNVDPAMFRRALEITD